MSEPAGETINPYAPPEEGSPERASDQEPPTIWNPHASALWCLLFPVPWGAVIHALNWRELGEPQEEKKQWTWAVALSIVIVVVLLIPANTSFGGLAILIIWYYGGARKQIAYVKTKHNDVYRKKAWALPMAIGVASLAVAVGLVFVSVWLFEEGF